VTTWTVRPDGGRPEGRGCPHADLPTPAIVPRSDLCLDCVARRQGWVALRLCLTCGHVGCCDSSPAAHANAHHENSGHPLMRSQEPGEDWGWCYVDEVFLRPNEADSDRNAHTRAG
jgi:hypothetical protein